MTALAVSLEARPSKRRVAPTRAVAVREPCYSAQNPPLAMGCARCGHPPYRHGCDVIGEHEYVVPSAELMAERLSLYVSLGLHRRRMSDAQPIRDHQCARATVELVEEITEVLDDVEAELVLSAAAADDPEVERELVDERDAVVLDDATTISPVLGGGQAVARRTPRSRLQHPFPSRRARVSDRHLAGGERVGAGGGRVSASGVRRRPRDPVRAPDRAAQPARVPLTGPRPDGGPPGARSPYPLPRAGVAVR
ncbi:hypothetical protein [Nonomuraea dietziae]|uniref:hypothetical protein n=1 Tax=Nonomuraea dietziae TaxID=65515 RepID=UPI00342DA4CD